MLRCLTIDRGEKRNFSAALWAGGACVYFLLTQRTIQDFSFLSENQKPNCVYGTSFSIIQKPVEREQGEYGD